MNITLVDWRQDDSNQPAQIGKEEIDAVTKVLKSGVLTHGLGTGPIVSEFKYSYGNFVKAKYVLPLTLEQLPCTQLLR
jgi:dTDP-4-amino-4,6-dideoxygalactose transaminase